MHDEPMRALLLLLLFAPACVPVLDDDDAVGEALRALYRRCERVVFLGSWPCDRATGSPPPDTADSVAWFESLRSGEVR